MKWKPIRGYKGRYEISKCGTIKSVARFVPCSRNPKFKKSIKEKLITQRVSQKDGYVRVTLWKNNKPSTFLVHRLVADTFIPNPENKPEVNHKNGSKVNNFSSNLEWCTSKENTKHAIKAKLILREGITNPQSKLSEIEVKLIKKMFKQKYSISKIHKLFKDKIGFTSVYNICKNITWKTVTL